MIKPTIHLNGSNKDQMLDAFIAAHEAMLAAIEALKQTAPNARDYYPQGASAFERSREEYACRLRALECVDSELMEIAESL